MITLKTLPQATAQEVFDQITQHLLKQGKAARSDTGACRYRVETQEGVLRCAAGCLIADDEYTSEFEDNAWHSLVVDREVPNEHVTLIKALQRIHDAYPSYDWSKLFVRLAIKYNLRYNPLQPS